MGTSIPPISRRTICAGLLGSAIGGPALAQNSGVNPGPDPGSGVASGRFDFGIVIEQARRMAGEPYHPPAPAGRPALSYDAYRDIRFRPDRAFLAENGSRFRLQLFPTGSVGSTKIAVNIVRGGVVRPVAFSHDLFDFGPHVTAQENAAVDGFAGFRLHYPLNSWTYFDEVIAFLGASYFRFVGRGQKYGQSTRGLAIGSGDPNQPEEFPLFREFWIEQPAPDADTIEITALLDGPSVAGAYRMSVTPGQNTAVEVQAQIFARASLDRLGVASMTSMYFTGESGARVLDDFRREVHDSCGLLVRSGAGEWIWRPLRNPAVHTLTRFPAPISGFGLLQRLRSFADYDDLEADYEQRPSYWVEPIAGFEQGAVELLELSEAAETGDNIVASWKPAAPVPAGQSHSWTYRISTRGADPDQNIVARARHTLLARSASNLAGAAPGAQRFLIDFVGRELAPYLAHPEDLDIVASVSAGRVAATSIARHPESPRLRVTLDVVPNAGQSADIKLALNSRGRQISETWTFPAQG